MAAPKKKPMIDASEIRVNNRTLEAVLLDLTEQTRANARLIEANAEQMKAYAERSAQIEERVARAEEMAALALKAIGAVSQDLRAIVQESRLFAELTRGRLDALEKAAE